ncbi:phosphopantetheine-binding protein [Streptomyces cinerochromogenes]|uniref:Phosphopantetheine-binding protein n=1 Tax=Streptomyces cinerochromogenes TaxID=66422 RepID=A0ABW7BHX8_9ACTN
MTELPWTSTFEKTLRVHLTLVPTEETIAPDLSLADHGLDSMATVSLILDLEEAFGVTIPDHLLTSSTFGTPAELWSAIASLTLGDSVG